MVETLLEGRAKDWYRSQQGQCANFDDFVTVFLAEFYSITTQVRLKSQWFSRRYSAADGAMQSYFLKQISVAQYFTPKLDQYEINYSVVQQLPGCARDALVTITYEDTNHVARAIAQLDMTYEDSRNRDGCRNPINGNAS